MVFEMALKVRMMLVDMLMSVVWGSVGLVGLVDWVGFVWFVGFVEWVSMLWVGLLLFGLCVV